MRAIAVSLVLTSLVRDTAACTALAVDGAASATGAAYAVENVDCDNCDFRLTYIPARDHEDGSQRPVYLQTAAYPRLVAYNRSEIYHPVAGQKAFEPVMYIPQVNHTYGYYESAAPLMNDQGLGISESSCAAMLLNKAPNVDENRSVPVAILDAAALMQIVLERCVTARCGVETMGQMCEEYGYLPFFGEPTQGIVEGKTEWDDAGEAYMLADASGEAWVVHVLGGVEGVIKSVWAARRVPKGHVAVVANEFTLGELPPEPNADYLFPTNIRHAAMIAGLWDGKGVFDFKKSFAPNGLLESAPAPTIPDPLYSALRKWRLLSLAAPSHNLTFNMAGEELPFSIKADHSITHREVMSMMGDHYGGTEFDMTKGVLAGPWGSPFRVEGSPTSNALDFAQVPRGISILRSIYSTISETGPNGSRVWFAPDVSATSVYMPLDHRSTALSPAMYIGTYTNFTRESAFWAFDHVANWMQLNYQGMSSEDVKPRQKQWQDTIDAELAGLIARNAGVEELSHWQASLQDRVVTDWWKLADELVVKWNDFEKFSGAWHYPEDWAKMVGMDNDVHPVWVKPASAPETQIDGYVAAKVSLPRSWNREKREWIDFTTPVQMGERTQQAPQESVMLQTTVFGALIFVAGSFSGFVVGKRQSRHGAAGHEHLLA